MKSIYSYKSYRAFLRDQYLAAKRSSPTVKLASYAKSIGFSTSGLAMILSGERNLTVENLHGLATALSLSRAEHEFFEALVFSEQASQPEIKRYYGKRLREVAQARKIKGVRVSERYLLKEWFIPALLVYLLDFELPKSQSLKALNYKLIAKKFGLSEAKLRELVRSFFVSGLLETSHGEQVHVIFDRLSAQLPQKNYIRSVLSEMLARLDHDFTNPHSIYRGFVFSIEESRIINLKAEINELFEKYMSHSKVAKEKNLLLQGLVTFSPL